MQPKLTVFLADDSFVVRERLAGMLAYLPGIEVVGQAENADEAIERIRQLQPHAVVLDIHMPPVGSSPDGEVQNGIDVLETLKREFPEMFVVMLSNYHYAQYRQKCKECGADAFLHKTREFEQVGEVLSREWLKLKDNPQTNASEDAKPLSASPLPVQSRPLPPDLRAQMRVPYTLRRVPLPDFATLLCPPQEVSSGDVLLVQLQKMGRNTRFELSSGRLCNLHEGDVLAVVVGNRYATEQFEGYAQMDGQACDLLSMGGLCGLVRSKHSGVSAPTRLHVLGALGDADGRALQLRNYALPLQNDKTRPRTIVVCGTSMDSGKTYSAFSLIFGLQSHGHRVGAYKLTGTAAGRDTWSMFDAGAFPALDFIDGGYPSTFLCPLEELLRLHDCLSYHVKSQGADWVVIEIADGLLQGETAALLQNPQFQNTVDAWIFAAGDPLAATGGVSVLRSWNIEPLALSGKFTQSPLSMREATHATGVPCLTSRDLKGGELNERLVDAVGGLDRNGAPFARVQDEANKQ